MDQETVNRVTATAKSYLPKHLDHEDIAIEICLESWQNGIEHPSRQFIYQRCIDAIRKDKAEARALTHVVPETPRTEEEDEDTTDKEALVGTLIMILSTQERKAIWYRFYKGLSIADVAHEMSMPINRLRELLEVAIFKMRNAGMD